MPCPWRVRKIRSGGRSRVRSATSPQRAGTYRMLGHSVRRSSAPTARGPDLLSLRDREYAIAVLVGKGLTSRESAGQLHITAKPSEHHLT